MGSNMSVENLLDFLNTDIDTLNDLLKTTRSSECRIKDTIVPDMSETEQVYLLCNGFDLEVVRYVKLMHEFDPQLPLNELVRQGVSYKKEGYDLLDKYESYIRPCIQYVDLNYKNIAANIENSNGDTGLYDAITDEVGKEVLNYDTDLYPYYAALSLLIDFNTSNRNSVIDDIKEQTMMYEDNYRFGVPSLRLINAALLKLYDKRRIFDVSKLGLAFGRNDKPSKYRKSVEERAAMIAYYDFKEEEILDAACVPYYIDANGNRYNNKNEQYKRAESIERVARLMYSGYGEDSKEVKLYGLSKADLDNARKIIALVQDEKPRTRKEIAL